MNPWSRTLRAKVHLKVDNVWSGAAVCGQSGDPEIVWGRDRRAVARRVTCRKCRKIMRRRS